MSTAPTDHTGLRQGDPALLDTELAQRLLAAPIPARVAFVALDGTPRVVPTWFHWTGRDLVMPTYLAGPRIGIRHPAARLAALRARPDVAVTIDTDTFPPQSLSLRGRVEITEVAGLAPEYAAAARRYLGEEAATGMLAAWTSRAPRRPGSCFGPPGSGCSTSTPGCPACRVVCNERRVHRAGHLGRRLHHRTGPVPRPAAGPRRQRPVRLVWRRRHA